MVLHISSCTPDLHYLHRTSNSPSQTPSRSSGSDSLHITMSPSSPYVHRITPCCVGSSSDVSSLPSLQGHRIKEGKSTVSDLRHTTHSMSPEYSIIPEPGSVDISLTFNAATTRNQPPIRLPSFRESFPEEWSAPLKSEMNRTPYSKHPYTFTPSPYAEVIPLPSDDETQTIYSAHSPPYSEMTDSPAPSELHRYLPLHPDTDYYQRLRPIHLTPAGGYEDNQTLEDCDSDSSRPSDTCCLSDSPDVPNKRTKRRLPSVRGAPSEWLNHAREIRDKDGTTSFQCTWTKDETPSPCAYQAQKQAMKRHVEAKHLRIKPHKCRYCYKSYPQKTALQVHEATHTGATPHACKYKCGQSYSDPARRHRHYVLVHGYIPRQCAKKMSYGDQTRGTGPTKFMPRLEGKERP